MMTNDEIRALVGELEYWCEADGMRSAIHYLANSKRAIETLLARQDDLAKHAHPYVLATDYAALEAERDDCQQEITNCRRIMEKQGIVIAALEADLKDARAELARVKAESLRVVPIGGRQIASSNRIEYFTLDGDVYHWESCQHERDEVFARGLTTGRDLDLRCSKLVQPVRLERWEMEE